MIFSKAGVTDNELKDQETAKFVYDFVEKHGSVESVNAQSCELSPPRRSSGIFHNIRYKLGSCVMQFRASFIPRR